MHVSYVYPNRHVSVSLEELGWDHQWAEAFAPFAEADVVPARVAIEFNHIYRLVRDDGELQAQHAASIMHRSAGRHELAAVRYWLSERR